MSGQNTPLTENSQRSAHSPTDRFNLVRRGSLVEVLNVWNNLDLGLKTLSKRKDGHIELVFSNRQAAKKARDRIFPEGCGQTAKLRSGGFSFIVSSDQFKRLIYLLPQEELQKKGIDVAELEKSFECSDKNFERPLCTFLMGGHRKEEREKILYDEFKEKFKQHCLDKLSPIQRFNVDFLPACFGGEGIAPLPVALDFFQSAQVIYPASASNMHVYPGQMVLAFASEEDCAKFINLLEKKEKERANEKGTSEIPWVAPKSSGCVMTLDLRRFYNLYPKTNKTKFSSHTDFKDCLDKIKPGIRTEFVSCLNNLLAVSAKTYRFWDAYYHASTGSEPDQYRMRFYVSDEADAEKVLKDIYDADEDKPNIVKGDDGLYFVDILPTRIYRLWDDPDVREFHDLTAMPDHRRFPLDVFKQALQKGERKEKSQHYFKELIEQAVSAVNLTNNLIRKDSRLTLSDVSLNADASTIKFSLSAYDEASLEKFRQLCLNAGCPYAKSDEVVRGLGKLRENFIFSVSDIDRLIKYLDEHPELIGEKRPLDFSTLRLQEELTYFETVLRFQPTIDDAAKTHKEGVSDDAYAKAQALYERIRAGYAHREYWYQEFRPEKGNHRLFSQPCGSDVWQLQQVKPDAKHPSVVTVACATRPGIELSDQIILDTLKKAIVAELFKSHMEGRKGQIDVRLDMTDRLGGKVSQAMQKRVTELTKTRDFTLKELGITEEMVNDNCGEGEKISLGCLYLDGEQVNDRLDARDQDTDTQYASSDAVSNEGDIVLGVASRGMGPGG